MLELEAQATAAPSADAQRTPPATGNHAPAKVTPAITRRPVGILLILLGVLALGVVTASGPVVHLDKAVAFAPWAASSSWGSALATLLALIGQRAYSAPELLIVAGLLAWHRRVLRPVTIALVGLLALNVVVGALKLLIARPSPLTDEWWPFAGGTDFPSGHASNTVLTWGLLAWLVLTFGRARTTAVRRRVAYCGVAAAALVVGGASLYLRTHWLSDIVAGWIVGFLLLLLVTSLHESPRAAQLLTRCERVVVRGLVKVRARPPGGSG